MVEELELLQHSLADLVPQLTKPLPVTQHRPREDQPEHPRYAICAPEPDSKAAVLALALHVDFEIVVGGDRDADDDEKAPLTTQCRRCTQPDSHRNISRISGRDG